MTLKSVLQLLGSYWDMVCVPDFVVHVLLKVGGLRMMLTTFSASGCVEGSNPLNSVLKHPGP